MTIGSIRAGMIAKNNHGEDVRLYLYPLLTAADKADAQPKATVSERMRETS